MKRFCLSLIVVAMSTMFAYAGGIKVVQGKASFMKNEGKVTVVFNWKEAKWVSNISVTHYVTIKDKNNWEDAINWHVDMVDKFKKVFIPRINDFYDRRS